MIDKEIHLTQGVCMTSLLIRHDDHIINRLGQRERCFLFDLGQPLTFDLSLNLTQSPDVSHDFTKPAPLLFLFRQQGCFYRNIALLSILF